MTLSCTTQFLQCQEGYMIKQMQNRRDQTQFKSIFYQTKCVSKTFTRAPPKLQGLARFPWKKWKRLKTTSKGSPCCSAGQHCQWPGKPELRSVMWISGRQQCEGRGKESRFWMFPSTAPHEAMEREWNLQPGCCFYGCCFRWRSWQKQLWVWMLPSCAGLYTACIMGCEIMFTTYSNFSIAWCSPFYPLWFRLT